MFLFVMQLNDSTDKMVEEFRKIFKREKKEKFYRVINLKEAEKTKDITEIATKMCENLKSSFDVTLWR